MAQFGIPSGYTLIATAEIVAFEKRCIKEVEQAKRTVIEKDAAIENARSLIETLLEEKNKLERRVKLLEDENNKLNLKVIGLQEVTSDQAANLQDIITTNDALTKQVKKLEYELKSCTCKSGAPVTIAWDSTTDTMHHPKLSDKVSDIHHSPVDIQSSSTDTFDLTRNCTHLNFNVGIESIRTRFPTSQTMRCHGTDKVSGSDELKYCFSSKTLHICLKCGTPRCEHHVPPHSAKHRTRHDVYLKMSSMAVWCSVCQSEIPSDYLTPEIKECQKLLQGKRLTSAKKANDFTEAGIAIRRDVYNKKFSTSTRRQSTHSDQHHGVHTTSPPAQVSTPKYQLGVSRPPSSQLPSPIAKHLPPTATTSTATTHNSVKHLSSSDGDSSYMTSAATTTTTKPSSSYTISPELSTNNANPISTGGHASEKTITHENLIVPVINTLSNNHTKPTSAIESNNPNHNETENFGRPTIMKNERNPKSLHIPKKDYLLSKPKISKPAQQTDNSFNPIKAVHPSTTPVTAVNDCSSKPADKKQTPTTYTSPTDRRPATPPPQRPPITTTTKPLTPPATRRYFDSPYSTYTSDYYRSSYSNYPVKGLRNIGLTCYFNAALQCLSRIPMFENLLNHLIQVGQCISLKTGNEKETVIEVLQPYGQVSKVLSETIDGMLSHKNGEWTDFLGILNPSNLLKEIRDRYTNFQLNRPCDSHEVMRCILDAVRMEEIKRVKKEVSNQLLKGGVSATFVDGEINLNHKAALRSAHKYKTYIDEVIGGELLSVVVCLECRHRAELIEPFLDISLPIPEYNSRFKPHTLEECLLTYTHCDILDEENKFICTKCSKQVGNTVELKSAMKQLTLKRLPPVLILHLKRFHIGIVVTKNSTQIKYPERVDVSQYCIEATARTTSTQYSLFAVVEHTGTLNFGHYIAYVKVSNEWYKTDDSIVTKVGSYEVLSREAYLLFYQQEN